MSEPDALEYQERVRRMLRQAFAEVPCPNTFKEAGDCGPLLHDVSLELRRDFYNYEPEEIHYLLQSPAINFGGHDGYPHR